MNRKIKYHIVEGILYLGIIFFIAVLVYQKGVYEGRMEFCRGGELGIDEDSQEIKCYEIGTIKEINNKFKYKDNMEGFNIDDIKI